MSKVIVDLVRKTAKEFDEPFTASELYEAIQTKYDYKQYKLNSRRIGRILRILPDVEKIGEKVLKYERNKRRVNLWIYRGK